MQLPFPLPVPISNSYHGSNIRHHQENIFPWQQEAKEVLKIYKPKCIVLDLDFTLWPTFFSAHTLPPYVPLNNRPSQLLCVDKSTQKPRMLSLYPEVQETIQFCLENNIMISIASKNSNRQDAEAILRSLGLWDHLHYPQIFHNRKTYHFRNLKSVTQFAYNDFMFFDDDVRNISACNGIGVNSYRVDRATGFNGKLLLKALKDCAKKFELRQYEHSLQCPHSHGQVVGRQFQRQSDIHQSHLHLDDNNKIDEVDEEMEEEEEEEEMLPEHFPTFAKKITSTSSTSSSSSSASSSSSSSTDICDNDDVLYCIDCIDSDNEDNGMYIV